MSRSGATGYASALNANDCGHMQMKGNEHWHSQWHPTQMAAGAAEYSRSHKQFMLSKIQE